VEGEVDKAQVVEPAPPASIQASDASNEDSAEVLPDTFAETVAEAIAENFAGADPEATVARQRRRPVSLTERDGRGRSSAVARRHSVTALSARGSRVANGDLAVVPREDKEQCVAEAKELKQELRILAQGNQANRAYLERLSKAAEDAAMRGYGIQRLTHTTRRTRVQKTTTTTDMRTMEQETSTQKTTKVESWIEEGSPSMTGVGVFYARGQRSIDKYSDGTEDVQEARIKGEAMFWLGGKTTADQQATTIYSFSKAMRPSTCCPRQQVHIPRLAVSC